MTLTLMVLRLSTLIFPTTKTDSRHFIYIYIYITINLYLSLEVLRILKQKNLPLKARFYNVWAYQQDPLQLYDDETSQIYIFMEIQSMNFSSSSWWFSQLKRERVIIFPVIITKLIDFNENINWEIRNKINTRKHHRHFSLAENHKEQTYIE